MLGAGRLGGGRFVVMVVVEGGAHDDGGAGLRGRRFRSLLCDGGGAMGTREWKAPVAGDGAGCG